ncbi:CxxH/CxxC protein [Thermoactinomyces mirandus]|uniref:CxxH/CxxC protein n=1 Tax=Thermoactinomyces mirandus TaxID=2756294 RepID=A0A7W1XTE0_9BACL|nr:CxxH/CxxC protein [Thermoactinomyces mirandus]MBA4602889.1 CxxH/CxxC protein [Thermoactinomyces mirandus]
MKESIWYACEEHVDITLDDFVDTYGIPPIMDVCGSLPSRAKCKWCGNKPKYQLKAMEPNTK